MAALGEGEGSRAGKPEVGLQTLEKQSHRLEGNFLTVKNPDACGGGRTVAGRCERNGVFSVEENIGAGGKRNLEDSGQVW